MHKKVYFIQSSIREEERRCVGWSSFGHVVARVVDDGLLFTCANDERLRIRTDRKSSDTHLLVDCAQNMFGTQTYYRNRVEDEVLAHRIIEYLTLYYGERHTNCSTLVEYLRTGIFAECDMARNSLMYNGGLNRFTGVEKLRTGDTLCVLYFKPRIAGSRYAPNEVRRHFRKARGGSYDADFQRLVGPKKHLTQERFHQLYGCGAFSDFHFLYCIGIHNGQPVCIQQVGRDNPKARTTKDPQTDVLITIGAYEMYGGRKAIPGYLFVKRGR